MSKLQRSSRKSLNLGIVASITPANNPMKPRTQASPWKVGLKHACPSLFGRRLCRFEDVLHSLGPVHIFHQRTRIDDWRHSSGNFPWMLHPASSEPSSAKHFLDLGTHENSNGASVELGFMSPNKIKSLDPKSGECGDWARSSR
jgi:hypothetical protein